MAKIQTYTIQNHQNLHRHQKNKQTNGCTKPAQALKKQKKQTTRCTKPAKAPKKIAKLKFPGTMGPLLSSCWIFFLFFWCLSMFGASSGLFFCFFWCLSMFLYISCQDHDEKSVFYQGFRPSKCIKHRYLQCFIIFLNENSLPHGVPPSKKRLCMDIWLRIIMARTCVSSCVKYIECMYVYIYIWHKYYIYGM